MADSNPDPEWMCENCPSNKNQTCGPWKENSYIFKSCKMMHQNHKGWKIVSDITAGDKAQNEDSFQSMTKIIVAAATSAEHQTAIREKIIGCPIQQIESYLDKVIADDRQLARKILRVAFSAYSNDPINLAIMAPSSEGKTYAAVKVCEIFPKEDVIFVGRMSPAALVHDKGTLVDANNVSIEERLAQLREKQSEDRKKEIRDLLSNSKKLIDLSGKIMLFLDAPHQDLWDRLKPILSHDKHEIEFKITGKSLGNFKTANIIIRGWPACIFCSAKNEKHSEIWSEIETRFVTSNPNMSVTKYKKANILSGMRKGLPDFAHGMIYNPDDEKYAKFYVKEIKDIIKKTSQNRLNPTWNPFHAIISEIFPNNEGITMRNYNRFTSFCNIETLINSERNYKIEFHKKDGSVESYAITSLRDIAGAIDIIGSSSTIPDDKLKFLSQVFELVVLEKIDDSVTTDTLAEKYAQVYGKQTNPKKILETYLYPLIDYGLIDYRDNPNDKRQKLFRLVARPGANTFDYIKSRIIEESKNDPLFMWTGILQLEKSSIMMGRIHRIFDSKGNAIGHNLLQKVLLEQMESNTFSEGQE